MKILISGSSGTLADSVISLGETLSHKLILVDKKKSGRCEYIIDVSKYTAIRNLFDMEKPDIIFHFAAETDVDFCETNKLDATVNNFIATKNLTDIAKDFDIPLIFTSTASIFNDEQNAPYKENTKPNPANYYALTKYLSEEYIKSNLTKYFIFRFAWLVGNPTIDKKFWGGIRNQLLSNQKKLFGVTDQFGSLSFADEFAEFLFSFLSSNKFGIYHFASEGIASRYQIISEVIRLKSLNNSLTLEEITLQNFHLKANRPKLETLDVNKIKDLNIKVINNWTKDLEVYINKYDF